MILIEEKEGSKIPGGTSLYVSFNYNALIVEKLKQCDVFSYDKNTHVWEVPCTNLAFLINNLKNIDSITLKVLPTIRHEDRTFELMLYRTKPMSHQYEGIQYGLNHNHWLLLDAPGLGKTLQLLYLALELRKREAIEHCLIICGVNSLKANWKEEIKLHTGESSKILGERLTKKGKTRVGSIQERVEDLSNPIKEFFVITNVESLRNDDVVKKLVKGPNKFDIIFFDEAHRCKNPQASQTKGLMKLQAKYMVAATGTLILNDPIDSFIPLKWLGIEHCTKTNFEYYYYIFGGPFSNEKIGFKNMKVLKDMISEHSLRREKKLLNLPEKNIINEYLDLEDDHRKFYNNIVDGVKDQVDKVTLNTSTVLSMVVRLRQATASPSILSSENISATKLDRCCDLVDEIVSNGDKVVVFSVFKEPLKVLYERLKKYNPTLNTGDVKQEQIAENRIDFQSTDKSKVFLATCQALGVGVTLNRASYAIFIDTPWTSGDYIQAQDRIHRIGTKEPVFIYNLIAKDTIDERVLEIVSDKEAISDYIVDDRVTEKSVNSLKKYIQEL